MLKIIPLIQGPVQTNAYLVADDQAGQTVVIDPAWDGQAILSAAQERNWQIVGLWLTHAHFDHIAAAAEIHASLDPRPALALHPADRPLYQAQGGAPMFGLQIAAGPAPDTLLAHGQTLHLGSYTFEVRHCPGHTPGHVVFYCAAEKLVFCGDVIFQGSIGRTDFPGGSYETLLESIQANLLSLPDETRLLSGHGQATTVGLEKAYNPFLS